MLQHNSQYLFFLPFGNQLAQKISALPIHKVAGGGDTEEMLGKAGLSNKFDDVFTCGTAALEFLKNGGMIPGLEALKD